MTTRNQIYSCGECGQILAVVHAAAGRLVCCGRPMMLAGEKDLPAKTGREIRVEPAATGPQPFWKCSNCKYVMQAAVPPEQCPSCQQICQFVDVTCYIPECGMTGSDPRLIAGG